MYIIIGVILGVHVHNYRCNIRCTCTYVPPSISLYTYPIQVSGDLLLYHQVPAPLPLLW